MANPARPWSTPNVLEFEPQLREAFLTLEDYLARSGGGGTGADEVFVGPTDPGVGGTYELWYDTDAALGSSEILYSAFTSNVTVTATTAATAQNVINPGNVTYDGAPVMVEFFAGQAQTPAVAGGQILCNLWDANTDLGFFSQVVTPFAGVFSVPVHVVRRLTPTAGLHNFNIRAWVSPSGTGTIGVGTGVAGTHGPGFIRVTRI